LCLLRMKLDSRQFGVARGASSHICAPREVCITLFFVDFIVSDSILLCG
jgi:hypothetical protein